MTPTDEELLALANSAVDDLLYDAQNDCQFPDYMRIADWLQGPSTLADMRGWIVEATLRAIAAERQAIRTMPVAEPVSDRDAIRPHLIAERQRWWSPEYPGQTPPPLAVWWRDEPEDGLSGFDTRQDLDAFLRGEPGPFIRRITGNEFPQLPCADNRALIREAMEALENRDGGRHDDDCKAFRPINGMCNCGHDEARTTLAKLRAHLEGEKE